MDRVKVFYVPLLLVLALVVEPVLAEEPSYDLSGGRETALLVTGGGLFGLGYVADQSYEPLTPDEIAALDAGGLNALDRTAVNNWSPGAARASDYLMYTSAVAPALLMLDQSARNQADVIGLMYLETAMLNSGLTYLLKNVFGRTRPYVYNDNPDIPLSLKTSHTSRRSFPSGHTSTAFASLVFLATVQTRLHPDSSANGWVWGGCLAAAATTGYLRYAAGMHFPTDIVAGATMGAFAGWVVPQLHEWEPAPGDPGEKARSAQQTVIGLSFGF